MRRLVIFLSLLLLVLPIVAQAALIDEINKAFRAVYARNPSQSEWSYWATRVQRGDKTTYDALVGAMGYEKARGFVLAATTVSSTTPAVSGFKVDKLLYPSALNPNFLPDGTLVKSAKSPNVYYIQAGKKSWVIPSVINRWLGENHYFKHDIIITVTDADLARYGQRASVNPIYAGKVLQHPNGTQFYIDDKLRKRQLSAAVRAALKFPGGNLYPTSIAHLEEFKTGPALASKTMQPGGMVVYDGPWHGGRIWRIEEGAGGALTKRLYLSDYIYEAAGYPDESQRVAVSATELARYQRGSNIERYADGYTVGIGNNVYVVQAGQLRLISSPALLSAMGYKQKYVLKQHPEFLQRYPKGQPIAAFKTVTNGTVKVTAEATPAPNAATNLVKVRPGIRTLIAQINDIALPVYDRELSAAENKFWVDYLYNGEVDTKAELVSAMKSRVSSGVWPTRTSRTAVVDADTLKNKWFPYLFYFVHQQEPSDADKEYWYGRIDSGDRNTIEKLGGTLQWLKDTAGLTHK